MLSPCWVRKWARPRCLSTRMVCVVRVRSRAFRYLSGASKIPTIFLPLPWQLFLLGFGVWTNTPNDPVLLPLHIWHDFRVAPLCISSLECLGVLIFPSSPLPRDSIYRRLINAYTCEYPPSPSSIAQVDGMAIQSFSNSTIRWSPPLIPKRHSRFHQRWSYSVFMFTRTLRGYKPVGFHSVYAHNWLGTRRDVRDPPF